jgi:anti-sigma28 factor (negative regulator of flagellin synthesis)
MRKRSSGRTGSNSTEQSSSQSESQQRVLTCGSVLARLLLICGAKVERLTAAVENADYVVPTMALSTAIVTELEWLNSEVQGLERH